ncbi:hypothetical protein K439DRAFT_1613224 [Ramaria rubella]|nr:hypothetical protein K439DRAFT_1613224 [Ramaria rubella]
MVEVRQIAEWGVDARCCSTNVADQIWDVNLFEAFCTEFWHAVWAVDRLEPAIDVIQSTIEDEGRGGLIIMEPKAVSDTKEQDFAQLMAKAGQEHAEILGDDGEDV